MKDFQEMTSDFNMVGSFEQSEEQLQRTEEWLKARSGRFTGSKIKDLMSCGRSTAKKEWGDSAKTFDFGATAERYIYNVGKERLTGLRSMNISSAPMRHGTEHEPLLIERLIKDGVITDFEERGFEQFPDYSNAGASVDGICTHEGRRVALELKCCVSWDGHFKRMYKPVDEKHDDFWQHQCEMKAVGLDALLYVVAHPMTVDSYDIQIVNASPVHQKQMQLRCEIADHAINMWDQHDYKTALEIACAEFEIVND